jgi:hypothetical protein
MRYGTVRASARFAERTAESDRVTQEPQAIVRGNAMPDMGVTDRDARGMAAFLYAIKGAAPSPVAMARSRTDSAARLPTRYS